jgi:hypothetical protein
MTPAEQRLPWRTFADAPTRWSLRVHVGGIDATLWDREVLAICAATELDRVHRYELAPLLRRRQREGRQIEWSWLVAGAPGLAPDDAPGEMSLREVCDWIGLEVRGLGRRPAKSARSRGAV